MIKKLFQTFTAFFKYVRINKPRTISDYSPKVRKIIKRINPEYLFWAIFIAITAGGTCGYISYKNQKYSFIVLFAKLAACPQLIGCGILFAIILLFSICLINKRLTSITELIENRLISIIEKVTVTHLICSYVFICLFLNTYMTVAFLLEPVNSYKMLYALIIQFDLVILVTYIDIILFSILAKDLFKALEKLIAKKSDDGNFANGAV